MNAVDVNVLPTSRHVGGVGAEISKTTRDCLRKNIKQLGSDAGIPAPRMAESASLTIKNLMLLFSGIAAVAGAGAVRAAGRGHVGPGKAAAVLWLRPGEPIQGGGGVRGAPSCSLRE